MVAIAVRDHGIGLRPGESSLVFNRFWRADPARARTTGGTGLGLSIASEDARLHGGRLQAWGERGKGSQFVLTLPRRAGAVVMKSPIRVEPADDQRGAVEPSASANAAIRSSCRRRARAASPPCGAAVSDVPRRGALAGRTRARRARLSASACTAVPDSGGVHAGNAGSTVGYGEGRRPGARTRSERRARQNIVLGFQFANSDIVNGLGTAKAYLADGASWQPKGVTVVGESSTVTVDAKR